MTPLTPFSPSDLRGLRFVRPDGSYDLRVILAHARRLVARWAADGKWGAIHGTGRKRWSNAMRDAWAAAKDDRSLLVTRLELKADAARLNALPPVERKLAWMQREIDALDMADGDIRPIRAAQAVIASRMAAIRALPTMEAAAQA